LPLALVAVAVACSSSDATKAASSTPDAAAEAGPIGTSVGTSGNPYTPAEAGADGAPTSECSMHLASYESTTLDCTPIVASNINGVTKPSGNPAQVTTGTAVCGTLDSSTASDTYSLKADPGCVTVVLQGDSVAGTVEDSANNKSPISTDQPTPFTVVKGPITVIVTSKSSVATTYKLYVQP
jgi:hypothetical protein